MKRILLISVMAMLTITSFGRKHVAENAVIVADTIYYAADKTSVTTSEYAKLQISEFDEEMTVKLLSLIDEAESRPQQARCLPGFLYEWYTESRR